ncbi:MAG: hypothetical protein HC784_11620, partial [Hydrococcus sp. CSU_1_8]|nr:hypothetical protein [Hydrococcus sp. CSU_1_8]
KVFKANDNNWKNFAYEIEQFLDAGDSVIVIGKYSGYHRISGKSMSAVAAHVYDLREVKVCRFRMFADTKTSGMQCLDSIWRSVIGEKI